MNTEILSLIDKIKKEISHLQFGTTPNELYDPIYYIMQLGGKRLRPLLVLLSYELFKDDSQKIMVPALGVELFHNFTLMHDDIMDKAPLRRGKETVHEKWGNNVAILSGDVMLVKVYDLLLKIEPQYLSSAISKFNLCASQVCEGQQIDMNFEKINDVSVDEYLQMITLKTAVLLGFCTELGALLSDTSPNEQALLRNFGTNMGIGFQLKDDLLDVYAEKEKFGKQVGGDIISNKKTFLLIHALDNAQGGTKIELTNWLQKKEFDSSEKINAIKNIYDELGVKNATETKMNEYFDISLQSLNQLNVEQQKKLPLLAFTNELINRDR